MDRACGYGVYQHTNGALYQGQWKDDQQHGQGYEKWVDGSSFLGGYSQGLKEGVGIYKWNDGSDYEGEWQQNKINGIVRDFLILLIMHRESTLGWMGESTKGNGKITTWTALAHISGMMVVATRENTGKIRSTALVYTTGLMVEFTLVTGQWASSMDWVLSSHQSTRA